MSLLDATGESFGEGNVTLLMVLGVISYSERMRRVRAAAAVDARNQPSRSRAARSTRGAARSRTSIDRIHPVDLAVLGIESFGMSVAGLCGPPPRRGRPARKPPAAPPAPRALRQVLR
jgi:hypothetical protein